MIKCFLVSVLCFWGITAAMSPGNKRPVRIPKRNRRSKGQKWRFLCGLQNTSEETYFFKDLPNTVEERDDDVQLSKSENHWKNIQPVTNVDVESDNDYVCLNPTKVYTRTLSIDALTVLNRTEAIPNIYFYLYNKETDVNGSEFRIDNINTDLIPIKNINIILIHGWTESHTRPHYLKIRDEYLKKYDCNVFSFDYNRLDQQGYTHAREIAPDVGELIAETLVLLKRSGKLNFDQVHVVAHSLGCHVAGFVGKNVFRLSNEKLGKITALDAAGPNYNGAPPEKRLTGTDAKSTVVIHTDGLLFGANENMGTLDIYFNPFRPLQPGCTVAEIIIDHGQAYCNHWISYQYFINTINKPQYIAIECSSAFLYVFGICFKNHQFLYTEDVNPDITGTYFVSAESPFGINARMGFM